MKSADETELPSFSRDCNSRFFSSADSEEASANKIVKP